MMTQNLLLFTTILAAATDPSPRPAEPAEIGAIHYFDAKTNALQPLEYRRGVSANRQSGFNSREILEVPGMKSPVRFKAGTSLEFIVRVLMPVPAGLAIWPSPQIVQKNGEDLQTLPSRVALVFKDPTNYDLLKLDPNPKSGNRELILTRRGFINSTGSFGIFVLLKQWTQESFHLRPAEILPPGEYAFKYGITQDDCRELHAFGIDP
jgi:hypothetical protein